jgi:hypothetical protein
MPLLRGLSPDEARSLIHKIKNEGRSVSDGYNQELIDSLVSKDIEKRLAKISEEENYLNKNRYRLQKTKLVHADKRRMPID